MPERFTVSPFEFTVLQTRTRFPFRYGIASMTDVPHLFVRVRVTAGAGSSYGVTSEGLPPKWFTKDPATTFDQDLPVMLEVIRHAADRAGDLAARPIAFFDLWQQLDATQSTWAAARGIAPLLAHLGVSLVERAILDGLCRIAGVPLHRMIAANHLGLRLGDVYEELHDTRPGDLLPSVPLARCFVRHTVGLGDALTEADIPPSERVSDGLPQDLEACIREQALRYFKVKLSGVPDRDLQRLRDLHSVLERATRGDYRMTLDGNENFQDMAGFRAFWETLVADQAFRELLRRTIVIEQPVHRSRALSADAGLSAWPDRPAMIVDESDGAVGDVPRALDLGYAGASYKSCKGIVKGIANACLLAKRRAEGRPGILTGEDLCTIGPVTLLQDLAMMATLGIEHVERNGHHYHRGLSAFPRAWQDGVLAAHDDLYTRHPAGFASLAIVDGAIDLTSVNRAPFGVHPAFDPSTFPPLAGPFDRLSAGPPR